LYSKTFPFVFMIDQKTVQVTQPIDTQYGHLNPSAPTVRMPTGATSGRAKWISDFGEYVKVEHYSVSGESGVSLT